MPQTPNLAMPLLFAAQAQKEITHNEALVLIDALIPGCIEAVASDPAVLDPATGNAWIVGADPSGVWAGRAGQVAIMTQGGWRYAPPVNGMRLYDRAGGIVRIFDGSDWLAPAAIADAEGGATIDVEARAAITALLAALRDAGMINAT